jgi:hypothetical protein
VAGSVRRATRPTSTSASIEEWKNGCRTYRTGSITFRRFPRSPHTLVCSGHVAPWQPWRNASTMPRTIPLPKCGSYPKGRISAANRNVVTLWSGLKSSLFRFLGSKRHDYAQAVAERQHKWFHSASLFPGPVNAVPPSWVHFLKRRRQL